MACGDDSNSSSFSTDEPNNKLQEMGDISNRTNEVLKLTKRSCLFCMVQLSNTFFFFFYKINFSVVNCSTGWR